MSGAGAAFVLGIEFTLTLIETFGGRISSLTLHDCII